MSVNIQARSSPLLDRPITKLSTKLDYFQLFNEIQFINEPSILTNLYGCDGLGIVDQRRAFASYCDSFRPLDFCKSLIEGFNLFYPCISESKESDIATIAEFNAHYQEEKGFIETKILFWIDEMVNILQISREEAILMEVLSQKQLILSFRVKINWKDIYNILRTELELHNETDEGVDKIWIMYWNGLIGHFLVNPPEWFRELPLDRTEPPRLSPGLLQLRDFLASNYPTWLTKEEISSKLGNQSERDIPEGSISSWLKEIRKRYPLEEQRREAERNIKEYRLKLSE